ncbi:intermembrane transport protein PqiB [Aestuariibacter sp. AA17]|uniref:Intermembrane transport protein PqiB n=1 Tax=Fluctibacter corallii TaxID=2984329 RepID=A0ABT3ABE4_9ALTE|nr:intermembrane transport protein PqiB [Aestuariibacter sp. AA17]MCV2885996.1 intermembrane transport protein PqiB [Aestuariibacter sp. AA17]
MSERDRNQAQIKKMTSISRIWIVPILALIVGGGFVYQQWVDRGQFVTIELEQATGLEADKTKIKTRDVDVGVVKSIQLKEDLSGVIVTAAIQKNATHLLRSDSKVWVVRPRVSLSGVTGLSTLVSGPYIAFSPGESNQLSDKFVALENPPVTPAGTPGMHITLTSNDDFSFKAGDSVVYKGLKVGEFESIEYDLDARSVAYNVFIEAPFHEILSPNTRFWNTSGLSFDISASGFTARTGSLETMLTNGVTFGVPDGQFRGGEINEDHQFEIFSDYQTASDQRYKRTVEFVLLVEETIRGLEVGAPVEYRGLKIGEVKTINLQGTLDNGLLRRGYRIPVLISLQPGRLTLGDTIEAEEKLKRDFAEWIPQGLRASLKMGNLLSGSLYVDINHYDELNANTTEMFNGLPVIPTVSNEFTQITQKVNAILDKVNGIPYSELTENMNNALLEFEKTASAFRQSAAAASQLIDDANQTQIIRDIERALHAFESLASDYAAGSSTQSTLSDTLKDIQRTLTEITPVIQQINDVPNRLIFVDGTEPTLEPKGRKP